MHVFSSSDGNPTEAGLMRAADRALYGVTRRNEGGTVFRFGHAVGISGNAGSLEVTGIPGQSYLLQRSTDLRTWSTLTNIVLNTPSNLYQDPAPPSPAAFYRVRTL